MSFLTTMAVGAVINIGMGGSAAALKGISGQIAATRKNVDSLVTGFGKLALASAPVGVAMGFAMNTGMDFQKQMSAVGAVSLQTVDEIAPLVQKAKDLGASTVFTATQIGQGMEVMAVAGFNTQDVLVGIEGTMAAASASGEDLTSTIEIVSGTLKGMRLETSEASKVSDVLALASARTKSSIGSLGAGMRNVTATAAGLGVTMPEATAAVALLQDVGIDASESGSSVKTMLERLAGAAKNGSVDLGGFAVKVGDAAGNMLPFPQVMANVQKGLGRIKGNLAQTSAATELFGLRGNKAGKELAEALQSGKFTTLLDELNGQFTDAARGAEGFEGAATKMSKLRLDNLAGAKEQLGGAMEGIAIEFEEIFEKSSAGGVMAAADFLSGIVKGMQGKEGGLAESFGQGLKEGFIVVRDTINQVRTALAGLAEKFGMSMGGDKVKMLGKIVAIFLVIFAVIAPIVGAVGTLMFVFSGVGGVIAGLVPIVVKLMLIGMALWAAWKVGGDEIIGMVIDTLKPAFDNLKASFGTLMQLIFGSGPATNVTSQQMMEGLQNVVLAVVAVVGAIITLISWIVRVGVFVFESISAPFRTAFSNISGGFIDMITGATSFKEAMVKIFTGLESLFTAPFRAAWGLILDTIAEFLATPMGKKLGDKLGFTAADMRRFSAEVTSSGGVTTDSLESKHSNMAKQALQREKNMKAAATSPEVNATVESKTTTNIKQDIQLKVDGQQVAIAGKRVEYEVSERSGYDNNPYQGRAVLEHGAIPVPR